MMVYLRINLDPLDLFLAAIEQKKDKIHSYNSKLFRMKELKMKESCIEEVKVHQWYIQQSADKKGKLVNIWNCIK
jgi:hypothetical protein